MACRPEEMALHMNEPYENADELIQDLLLWTDAVIAYTYEKDAWVGRDPRLRDLMGIVVTRETFEHELENAMQIECAGQGADAELIDDMLRSRMEKTVDENPYLCAVRVLELNETEEKCLRLAIAPVLDAKYEKLFAYLQDDVNKKRPCIELCARICGKGLAARAEWQIRSSRALGLLMDATRWHEGELVPCSTLMGMLFGKEEMENAWEEAYVPLYEENIERMARLCAQKVHTCVQLCGRAGIGRRTALRRACGRPVVSCKPAELACGAVRAALSGGVLCVDAQEEDSIDLTVLPKGLYPVFVLADVEAASGEGMLRLDFDEPGDAEREAMFAAHAKALGVELGGSAAMLAAKFLFTPELICGAMQAAYFKQTGLGRALTVQELHESCYERLPKAQGMTQQARTDFIFDDLILPEREKRQLKLAVQQVLLRRTVYEDWGFGSSAPYGRGVSILLSGPPGTGKTMAARILARELNMHLMVVQLSQVISKYIGETEKNLQRVFEQAKLGSQVLFFDECDALFGKRAEVQNAQDRHANAEVAYLLQQMEAFDGVTLLATNLSQNIDSAFMRRMKFAVHFPFPDAATRKILYERMLSSRAPLDEALDLDFMARTFEVAGGNIKNIVQRAAFLAAEEDCGIGMRHLVRAAADEQRKNEIVVVRESLQEYADLLEDI